MEPAKSSSSIFERFSRIRRRSSMFEGRPEANDSSITTYSTESSVSLIKKHKKRKNYQNTYRLEPDERPHLAEIKEKLAKVVEASCFDVAYQLGCP